MIIKDIQIFPLRLPVDTLGAGGFKGADWKSICVVLVRIETDEGAVGWGESFGYSCWRAVVFALRDMFVPLLVGKSVDKIDDLMHSVRQQMHTYGHSGIGMFALAGADIALWDLKGKLAGKPLFALLCETEHEGARSVTVPVPKLTAYASLFKYGDSETVRANCRRALELGYKAIKLHENNEREIEAARKEIGDDIPLATDVNCCWSLPEARTAVSRFQPYDLMWLEEPIFPPDDYESLAALRQTGRQVGRQTGKPVAIAAGENASTLHAFRQLLGCGAVDFVQPSVTKVGGITEFVKIARLVRQHRAVHLAPHSAYFGPGLLATIHLCAAEKHPPMVERFFIEPEADLFNGLIAPTEGFYQPSDLPGLGADPDEEVIKDYLIKDCTASEND